MGSTKARKSRKRLFSAPLHIRKAGMHAGLSEELRQKLKTKRNSVAVRKGDTVKVISGKRKGTTGKVMAADTRNACVFMEGASKRNSKGIEKPIPINPSNLQIIDGDFSGWRKKILERSGNKA
ncbi:50S ribosomal protein L24 [Candidatus Micrarchaeota archaeon CG11_big_fil_rev_8_21_14_0_20_47_5]|nr:MAG: 50S ribosomal protein L24 [Candidatus Micrarchaeota archaeon CG1_02_47_40]PIN84261.1 MAG: 50S ribosomal protein L24 [Candidatus Micrarchaeota archaeon CG11_big_fil_rev_8_21_14_0_20_47_5]